MAYLLDANVFIEAKRRHYGMDFCPAFWDWLVEKNAADRVFSIEKVGDELRSGADELADGRQTSATLSSFALTRRWSPASRALATG